MVRVLKSKFLAVRCGRCGNQQHVFGKSSLRVKCINCNKLLCLPTGGKVKIRTLVVKVFH